jgi:hypothetical protein
MPSTPLAAAAACLFGLALERDRAADRTVVRQT